MYYITSEASFDGAHFLRNYSGKCRNLHGNRAGSYEVVRVTERHSDGRHA